MQVSKQQSCRIAHLLAAFCLLLTLSSFAQKPVPELWGAHVHDEAHALRQATIDQIEKQLITFEDSTSNQVAVLVVTSLDGESIEEYALRVAEKWKLGQKDKDNGVLLLIAIDDHKMRIEVGQGLQGVLTDVQSNRIIRNEIAPHFRKSDYDAGVIAGTEGIVKSIGGEYTANDANGEFDIVTRIVVGFAVFLILGIFTTVSLVLIEGRAIWWVYAGLIPFYIAFPWIAIGITGGAILLVIYLIGFPLAKMLINKNNKRETSFPSKGKSSDKRSDRNDSSFSSSGSGSWSSSNNSGSSFSGGGGSFDGGGSSGSW